jgi:hypothetical protein
MENKRWEICEWRGGDSEAAWRRVVNRMELLVRTGIKNEIERVLDITTYGQPAFNNRAKQIVLQIRNADGDINERG